MGRQKVNWKGTFPTHKLLNFDMNTVLILWVFPPLTAERTPPQCLPPLTAGHTPPQCLSHLLLNIHHLSVSPTYCWTYTTSVSSPLTAECTLPQCLSHLLLNIHHLSVSPHLMLNINHLSVSPTYCWKYTTSVSPPLTAEHKSPQCIPKLLLKVHHFSVSPHLLLNINHLSVSPTYCWKYTTSVSPPLTAEHKSH